MSLQRVVSSSFLIAVLMSGSYGFYWMNNNQQELAQQIQYLSRSLETKDTQQPQPEKIVERVVTTSGPWSALQKKMNNSVVQVFSQVGEFNWLEPYKTPRQHQALGSAFFINDRGHLITNAHVVDQAKALYIQISSLGRRLVDVEIIGVCPERDLALLRIKDHELDYVRMALGEIPHLPLGDSDILNRADEIMAVGYPLGQQSLKSTTGIVSGRESHLIQISAPINPGSSGGPSVNMEGQVIGINASGITSAQNVGYLIPVNELKLILADLEKTMLLRKPFLGVLYNNASEAATSLLGNPQPGGLYVVDIYKNSPLHKAGVQAGDMIYEVNGHSLDIYGEMSVPWSEDKVSIIDYVGRLALGEKVDIVYYRGGKRNEVTMKFDQAEPLPVRRRFPAYETIDYEVVGGMVVMDLALNHVPALIEKSSALAKYADMKHQMEPALIVSHVLPNSQVARSRILGPGAILDEINGVKVKTLAEFRNAMTKSMDNGFFTIKTVEKAFAVYPFKSMIKEEKMLASTYFYPVTETVSSFMAQLEEQDKNLERGSIEAVQA